MKIIIQHTDSDGKTKFIEKVATCRPEGMLSMTDDVFDDAMYEQQFEVDNMKDGMENTRLESSFST